MAHVRGLETAVSTADRRGSRKLALEVLADLAEYLDPARRAADSRDLADVRLELEPAPGGLTAKFAFSLPSLRSPSAPNPICADLALTILSQLSCEEEDVHEAPEESPQQRTEAPALENHLTVVADDDYGTGLLERQNRVWLTVLRELGRENKAPAIREIVPALTEPSEDPTTWADRLRWWLVWLLIGDLNPDGDQTEENEIPNSAGEADAPMAPFEPRPRKVTSFTWSTRSEEARLAVSVLHELSREFLEFEEQAEVPVRPKVAPAEATPRRFALVPAPRAGSGDALLSLLAVFGDLARPPSMPRLEIEASDPEGIPVKQAPKAHVFLAPAHTHPSINGWLAVFSELAAQRQESGEAA